MNPTPDPNSTPERAPAAPGRGAGAARFRQEFLQECRHGQRKLREDSLWNRLTSAQRDTLDGWLFAENLGYAQVVTRVRDEFGLPTSVASVGRYFRRRARERQADELVESQAAAEAINRLPVSTGQLRAAALKLASKAALQLVTEQPERLEDVVALTRLLLESEANDLRRERLRLEARQFEHAMATATAGDLPKLRAYLKVIADDDQLSGEAKVQRVRDLLFGWGQVKAPPPTPGAN